MSKTGMDCAYAITNGEAHKVGAGNGVATNTSTHAMRRVAGNRGQGEWAGFPLFVIWRRNA
jgi:hypothetical protein